MHGKIYIYIYISWLICRLRRLFITVTNMQHLAAGFNFMIQQDSVFRTLSWCIDAFAARQRCVYVLLDAAGCVGPGHLLWTQ